MSEKPILFSADMVNAILDGRKTQTRRIVKENHLAVVNDLLSLIVAGNWEKRPFPYGRIGDRLWVRETFAYGLNDKNKKLIYKADNPNAGWLVKWIPSIHMPRWASRITLEITDIHLQRVRNIPGGDAVKEGYPHRDPSTFDGINIAYAYEMAIDWYKDLWNSIYSKRGYDWNKNPLVWVIEFKRILENI